ncbi:MAG: dockerin type I repeat-containing protein [Chloroflexi bacterium]|nr:dockerin type I repeat-containing protein [Chloroflexota bacterium]
MTIRKQSESGRLAILGAVLVALVAGAFYLVDQFGITSASDPNPPAQMLLVASPAAPCGTPIHGPDPDEVCYTTGTMFTLAIDIAKAPVGGYVLAQSYLKFGDQLVYNQQNIVPNPNATPEKLGEIVWPDCDISVRGYADGDGVTTLDPSAAQFVNHGCLTALLPMDQFDSSFEGNFLELSFDCSSGNTSTTIELLEEGAPIAGTSGAQFKDTSNTVTVPKVDSLVVNCGAGGLLEPTPTLTPTVTPTHTPTVTLTPTPTVTPTLVPGPIMSLRAFGDNVDNCGAAPGPTPTPLFKAVSCKVQFFPGQEKEGTFTLTVNANVLPTPPAGDGYGGFQSELLLSEGLTYNPRTACGDEVVWPQASVESCDVFIEEDVNSSSFGITRVRHEATSASTPNFPLSTHVGKLLELDLHCDGEGLQRIVLTRVPTASNGAAYISATDSTIEVGEVNPADNAADVLTIDCELGPPKLSLTAFGSHIAGCDTDPTAAPAQTATPAITPTITDTPTPTPTRVNPLKCTADFLPDDITTTDIDESAGSEFTIAVEADAIPDGYGGFQLELWYGALKPVLNSCAEQVVWRPNDAAGNDVDGVVCSQLVTGDNVRRISAQTRDFVQLPENKDLGRLAEFEFKCTDQEQVRLVLTAFTLASTNPFPGPILLDLNNSGSAFYPANVDSPFPGGVPGPFNWPVESLQGLTTVDQDGDGVVEDTAPPGTPVPEGDAFLVLDLLRINCLAPPAATVTPTITPTSENPPATPKCAPEPAVCPTHTPTDTPTQTDTPTSTETPTITETPTPTQTPAPPDFAQEEVPPGGTVSTGTNAVPGDPIETSVTLPVGGQVSIVEKLIVQPNPTGFTLFGQQVNISAPAGTQQLPLIIQFLIDESIVPDGITAATLPIFKGGVFVPPCAGPAHKASPDPCVAKRNRLTGPAEDDIQITVHTSTASAWNFGQSGGGANPALGDVNGNGSIDPLDALLVLFHTAGMSDVPFPNVADVNSDGSIDAIDATLILQFAADLIGGFTAGTPSGAFWTWLRS